MFLTETLSCNFSGGIEITVTGEHTDSVKEPVMEVTATSKQSTSKIYQVF